MCLCDVIAGHLTLLLGHLIPKKFTSFSPIRDNVITMVAMSLDAAGQKKSEIRTSLESVFEHGCHCAWNFGRRKYQLDFGSYRK